MTQIIHTLENSPSLLEDTIQSFRTFKVGMVELMCRLRAVKESGVWEGKFGSWGEFVESDDGLGISQGFASKLLSVAEHYLVQGRLSQEKIAGIDVERLYLAEKLDGTPEEQVEKARLLTRSELKQSRAEDKHHEAAFGTFCSICWLSKENHP